MKISELPESPGRDLLMRLAYLDNQPGGEGLHEHYRQDSDATRYYLVLLANLIAEDRGDINSVGLPISKVVEYFAGVREETRRHQQRKASRNVEVREETPCTMDSELMEASVMLIQKALHDGR